jgi:hypothetical protein
VAAYRLLSRLKDVKDKDHVGPDMITIEARLQYLARQAADAITECANACDTYSKKKLIVKVLKAPIWESKLAEFAGRFHELKSCFKFALAIHTATMTDEIKVGVESIHQKYVLVDSPQQTLSSLAYLGSLSLQISFAAFSVT